MNAILGYAQILDGDPELELRHRKAVNTIGSSGQHLLGLINDILDISKIEAGHEQLNPVGFDLQGLVQAVSAMFEMRCQQKGLAWELESDVPEGITIGDEGKLRQALINLLGNAAKFTDKGTVTLQVKTLDDNRYAFHVCDTGPGIPDEKQAAIFEPFQQDQAGLQHGGTGLGLAISMRHIEMMGGQIHLESQLGEGSRFFFTIELPPGQMSETSGTSYDWSLVRRLSTGQNVTALVADSIETNRNIFAQMLTTVGVNVSTAENGALVLEHINDQMPDIIFMDTRMPVLSGSETLLKLFERHGKDATKVIVVTASAFDHERESYIQMGFDGVLSKPVTAELIYECLVNQLNIDFDFSDPTQETTETDWTAITLPPKLYKELYHAADSHSITNLRRALKNLETVSPELALHFGELAQTFNMSGIQAILDEMPST